MTRIELLTKGKFMSSNDRSQELIAVAIDNYLKSYANLHGTKPTPDVIKSVIRDLETLAIEKERQELINRFSNWTPKNIKEGIEMFKAALNPLGMNLHTETEDTQFYVEQTKSTDKSPIVNDNRSQKQKKR